MVRSHARRASADRLKIEVTPGQPPTAQQQRRDASARQAVAAAVAVAREHGVRVDEPVILNEMVSVVVHLKPAPIVARVPTWSRRLVDSVSDAMQREIAVTSHLASRGAPVVPPSPELPPGPHEHDGMVVGFWTYVEPDPERTISEADCAAMLPDLHAALRGYPGELPGLDPGVIDTHRWLAAIDRTGHLLSEDDIATIHAAVERLRPFLFDPATAVQPLHGDVHDENLIATRNGLYWIDFENVCRGPIEWDLTMIRDEAALSTIPYDPGVLARCRAVKSLQVALGLTAMADIFSDIDILNRSIHRQIANLRNVT
jgi:hypothetical protein